MAQLQPQWHNLCFDKPRHFIRKRSHLRVVTKAMCEKFPSILRGEKICDTCRKQLATATPRKQVSPPQEESESSLESDVEFPADEEFDDSKATLALAIGVTPVTRRKLRSKQYRRQKLQAVTEMIQKAVLEDTREMSDESEINFQLKQKYSTVSRSKKIQILTVLPKAGLFAKSKQSLEHPIAWPENRRSCSGRKEYSPVLIQNLVVLSLKGKEQVQYSMPRSYTVDIRWHVAWLYIAHRCSSSEISTLLLLSERSVRRYISLFHQTGDVQAKS